MKRIVREFQFTPAEEQRVRELSRAVGITETTAGILFARGMDSEEKMRRFLAPSKENLLSPFLMKGMKEAVLLLERAKKEEWRVAVFGDYDADGIGAVSILSRALKEYGIEPYLYVPERAEGYGLTTNAIDRIFDEFLPDLIITVDCGISNASEVEYIKEQGCYVIVTDHHELPETLPDCICINPKLKDDYPYDNLCGAGVAYKLSRALIGERADVLLDFCALSTVADSVPLLGENRDIVAAGLELIKSRPRPAFSALLGKVQDISAQTLAFTLAPRVNAAGRMGDANAALRLFTSEDEEETRVLAELLNNYNSERQRLCDELFERARAQIAAEGAYGNVVMAEGEDWHPGLIGIVAARIVEEFSRPALLFVKRGEMLRGSARSIESVNIFEALRSCSDEIEEFGGHAQAAGVNVRADRFEALRTDLDHYIATHYTREDFIPSLVVSGEIEGEFPRRLAYEIESLEPFGVGNRRPLFVCRAKRLRAAPVKPASPHLAIGGEALELMYFWGEKDLTLLRSDTPKSLVFECNVSKFRGKESIKGFVRAVVYDGAQGEDISAEGFYEGMMALKEGRPCKAERMGEKELNDYIAAARRQCAYGLVAVAYDRRVLARFPALKGLPAEVFRLSSGNAANVVLLSPAPDCDLSAYREVVFLESPAVIAQPTGRARLIANGERCGWEKLVSLPHTRADMAEVFSAIRAAEGTLHGADAAEAGRSADFLGFGEERFLFAFAVFEELGLLEIRDGRVRIIRGKKTQLERSKIYSTVCELAEK